jgi:hypothetical protein
MAFSAGDKLGPFVPLCTDPRFQDLRRRINLPPVR